MYKLAVRISEGHETTAVISVYDKGDICYVSENGYDFEMTHSEAAKAFLRVANAYAAKFLRQKELPLPI